MKVVVRDDNHVAAICRRPGNALFIPVGPAARPTRHEEVGPTERNHYAVVVLGRAGEELRGWDFKTLGLALAFANDARLKALRVEIWARDEWGRRLARVFPTPSRAPGAPRFDCGQAPYRSH
jgi:hypothetical protein